MQHHRTFPDAEVEMTEAEECRFILPAAVASWTMTKFKKAAQLNIAIQANPQEQLATEGMVN